MGALINEGRWAVASSFTLLIWSLGLANAAPALREGERLGGLAFHTYIDVLVGTQKRAERWVEMNDDLEGLWIVETSEGVVVRVPHVFENVLRTIHGQTSVMPSYQRIEDGVLIEAIGEAKETEEEALRALEAAKRREEGSLTDDSFPVTNLRIEPVPSANGDRMFHGVHGDRHVDLLNAARTRAQSLGPPLAELLRRPAAMFEATPIADKWFFEGASLQTRPILQANAWKTSHRTPDRSVWASVGLGRLRNLHPSEDEQNVLRHALLTRAVYATEVSAETFDGGTVLVCRYPEKRDPAWYQRNPHPVEWLRTAAPIEVVWQSGDRRVIYLSFSAGEGEAIRPLIEAYLAWHPSTWPAADYRFDRRQWVRTNIDIALELFAGQASPKTQRQVASRLTHHLSWPTNAHRDIEYVHQAEMAGQVEQWVETPVRIRLPFRDLPITQAEYDADVLTLADWWPAHRDEFVLREGAPVTESAAMYLDNQIGEDQLALNRALFKAMEAGDVKRVKQLLQQGADVRAQVGPDDSFAGNPAIVYAVHLGNLALVDALLEAGATPNRTWRHQGTLPLYLAIMRGNMPIVRRLVEAGATFDELDLRELMVRAANQDKIELAQMLVERGAQLAPAPAERIRLPMMEAASGGRAEFVRYLLQNGVDPNTRDHTGSALKAAITRSGMMENNLDTVRVLLDAGAAPDGEALAVAAVDGQVEAVQLLLGAGADPRQIAGYGFREDRREATPLEHVRVEIARRGYNDRTSGEGPRRMAKVVALLEEALRQSQ